MDEANKITVLLADDHTVIREGLKMMLEAAGDIKVVGEAENGQQAVQMTKRLEPNVLLLDLAMPQLNGIEATKQIIRESPSTKVLILSTYSDDDFVHQVIEEGAKGYLVKQSAGQDLLKAVREANKGNTFFSPSISSRLVAQSNKAFAQTGTKKRANPRLTSREKEVLQLIAEGLANKQIADQLKISIKTVEKHRQQMMSKLNIHEVASLTRYALSKGLITSRAAQQAQTPQPVPSGQG
jgi:DNA-binding NarL/FixJ family response regulator